MLFLNNICILHQLKMFYLDDSFNLAQVYKDIELKYGRTRTKDFFSTVRVVSLGSRMLYINLLKHLFIKFSEQSFFKKICFIKQ